MKYLVLPNDLAGGDEFLQLPVSGAAHSSNVRSSSVADSHRIWCLVFADEPDVHLAIVAIEEVRCVEQTAFSGSADVVLDPDVDPFPRSRAALREGNDLVFPTFSH